MTVAIRSPQGLVLPTYRDVETAAGACAASPTTPPL